MSSILRLHVHGMDCADEAALVRRAVASMPGIGRLQFDLINGLVDIEYDPGAATEAAILVAVARTGLPVHAVHGDAGRRQVDDERAAPPQDHHHHGDVSTSATAASGVLFAAGWLLESLAAEHIFETFVHHTHDARAAVAYGLSAFAGLWPMWPRALAAVRHRRLDMHVLVCLTVIGAAAIGEWSEGAAVAFLFAVAHRLEAWSIERARAEIAALVGRGPALIAEGVREAAPVEQWIERFAAVYTPAVTLAALVVALVPPLVVDGQWSVWFYRALVFLVLACPCALVISTPVTMVAALTAAARRGILVSSAAALERAAAAETPTRPGLAAAGLEIATTGSRAERIVAADVVLADAGEDVIVELVTHARRAMRVVRQNVAIALVTKAAFLVSAPFGFAPLWMAVLADTGATVIVTINGLRLARSRPD